MHEIAPITFLILARDEQVNLPFALASLAGWAAAVYVIDSGSTDDTRRLTEEAGVHFVQHEWEGYASQRNWALDHLPITTPWVFFLDADEAITPELREELSRLAVENKCAENGFYVNRRIVFMGKWIRHGGYYPSWNIRFFRRGKARYELRPVHEHMIVEGAVGYLRGEMLHEDRRGLYHYIEKHNWYSTLEAKELVQATLEGDSRQKVHLFGAGSVERRRWIKRYIWPRLPFRWFARWFSMYILKLGFLDGRIGFHFCVMLAIYEYQIELKVMELRQEQRKKPLLAGGQKQEPVSQGR